jgi:hypothetical protein
MIDKNLEVFGEYANTALVNDLRATSNGAEKKDWQLGFFHLIRLWRAILHIMAESI